MKIGYLLDSFPSITLTFVLNEITGLIDAGRSVGLISLRRPSNDEIVHDQYMKYGLDKKIFYLSSGKYEKESPVTISKEVFKKLFVSRLLNFRERAKLLFLCNNRALGWEISLKHFLWSLEIAEIIKNQDIKHLHLHFASPLVELAYVLHRFLGIPYTFTTHANDIFVNPSHLLRKWANSAKTVITVSEFNKRYMNARFGIPPDKIDIVTYSIYVDKIEVKPKCPNDPFKIVSISRLVEKKGYHYLLEACKILKDRDVNFSCEIRGEGPQKSTLEKIMITNGLQKEVTIGGFVKHEDVFGFITSGSVFVLPCVRARDNDMDGIPNVLMEAMALEVPTLSTDITGVPELIDDGIDGMIVPQNDPRSLAEAILKIKNDPNFAETIRKNGRKKIQTKFNVARNVKLLYEVLAR
jgi:colanic acid/amylovoran biosynthesis glycosyltransferase